MRVNIGSKNSNQKTGIVGKIFISLFFLLFFAAGCFFCYFIFKEVSHIYDTYQWKEGRAKLLDYSIKRNQKHSEDDTPYELSVRYSYRYDGNQYTSSDLGSGSRFSSYEEANNIVGELTLSEEIPCYVNPENPSEVILRHQSMWMALFIFIPLIFVLVGGGGIYGTWFSSESSERKRQSIAKKHGRSSLASGKGILLFLGLIFTLIGGGFTYYFATRVLLTFQAQSWEQVTARVIESDIIRHESTDDDGHTSITYSVDIFYQYNFGGKSYRASRYTFFSGSSSGLSSKREIIKEYRQGKDVIAYVNPDNPKQAVLKPQFTLFYLIGLIPLVFLVAGLWMLIASQRKARDVSSSFSEDGSQIQTGPVLLQPQTSPIMKVVGAIFICLFWNGIVSVFLYQAYKSWASGSPDWFLMLFLIPFVLIGLFFVGLIFYFILALFNPRVLLTISSGQPRLGEELEITWQTEGKAKMMNELSLMIEAREEATYRRGTDTVTDKHTFFQKEITKQQSTHAIRTGSAQITIPDDSMHSFTASNNKIIWNLKLKGVIPRWPDVGEEYAITVLPQGGV